MSMHSPSSAWRTAARTATRAAVTVVAVTALAATASATAHADETDPVTDEIVLGTEPPAEPEEAVVDVPAPEVTQDPGSGLEDELEIPRPAKPPTDGVNREVCDRANIYTPQTKGGKYHKGVGPTLSNTNNTSRTAKSTFTSEVSSTVGVSVTAGLTVSVDRLIAKIEAKYEVNLSASLTAKLGNSISVDTPSRTTTNAKYGVYRLKNTGVSYTIYDNCQTSAKKTITSYSPMKVGWYLWED
ncbi:hypothetical protein [Streptomyces sp. 2A115]|uniref:hypothetical protein n=1 Tax=Streptomyces sp. 2A115 TaxID=3457439 RepID=UPI003FD5C8C5